MNEGLGELRVSQTLFYIIGKFDIRRTLDKKNPHKSGHRKQTID